MEGFVCATNYFTLSVTNTQIVDPKGFKDPMWNSWNFVLGPFCLFMFFSFIFLKKLNSLRVVHVNNPTSSLIYYHLIPLTGTISERKETCVYNLKTRKTSPCKTAVSVISVFKSYAMLKQ